MPLSVLFREDSAMIPYLESFTILGIAVEVTPDSKYCLYRLLIWRHCAKRP